MSTAPSGITIRPAIRDDLRALYKLVSPALPLDLFSADLLAEKLFENPNPQQTEYRVLIAEAKGEPLGMMQAVSRAADARGWLGMFAVRASDRRTGIGRAMLDRVEQAWRAEGVREIEALAIPGNYFTPGIDPRYTEGLCFLERNGFERFKDCVNLLAGLDEHLDTAQDEAELLASGVSVRRAVADDDARFIAFFSEAFGDSWLTEARLAMNNDPLGVHVAIKEDRFIGFAAHSAQNREWGFFGPMGTLPAARGLGVGRVLLRRCLNDLRDAGHKTAVIPWVGPIAFYAHHAGCRVERVFWRYRKTLA